ncbi:hypothetical protein JB92DRAFT_2838607 [Gautieria morchelliformis]|nr:hypothetical protein JB92DRAFT_2838607 [Gautieria morchelliformis]
MLSELSTRRERASVGGWYLVAGCALGLDSKNEGLEGAAGQEAFTSSTDSALRPWRSPFLVDSIALVAGHQFSLLKSAWLWHSFVLFGIQGGDINSKRDGVPSLRDCGAPKKLSWSSITPRLNNPRLVPQPKLKVRGGGGALGLAASGQFRRKGLITLSAPQFPLFSQLTYSRDTFVTPSMRAPHRRYWPPVCQLAIR